MNLPVLLYVIDLVVKKIIALKLETAYKRTQKKLHINEHGIN